MSWDRTCCMSSTSSSTGSGSSSTFSPVSSTRDYDLPPPPPVSSSSFFFFASSDYIDEPSTKEPDQLTSLPPPAQLYNYQHPPLYSPIFASRINVSDACSCHTGSAYSSQVPSYEMPSSFQTPLLYEQYLTSFKSEQSEHLPYLFDNIIYPQPCSPPSPTNDAITYYQLDQANPTTTTINRFPPRSHSVQTIQPIIYQQLSLTEPPSSGIEQKLPLVKRFYYDSSMSNTTTTTIMTTTPTLTNTHGNDQLNLPYARLESSYFGIYDIWQERTVVGRKNNRRDIDVNMGTISVVSRIHFELILVNGVEFHLKCLSKNGLFVNNTYTQMSSTTVLHKQCTLRFPSTDLCISFSSLISNPTNHSISRTFSESISPPISIDTSLQQQQCSSMSTPMDIIPTVSFQSVPDFTSPPQQVILVAVNQQNSEYPASHSLLPGNNNLPHTSFDSSFSIDNSSGQMKTQHPSPTTNSFLGSSCPTSPKLEPNENPPLASSPIIHRIASTSMDPIAQDSHENRLKNGTKPPFSYAQLIVQAILSAPDKQMTLSQIYNYITAQYPYYEANNRGWQNSIRHNLSLNRYFIRLARKENESGKGSFWRLDQTCEEKLIDHAFRHRKQRTNPTHSSNIKIELEEIHSPTTHSDFLLADLHTSNPSTPLSSVTSPISPTQPTEDSKRKRSETIAGDPIVSEVENLLYALLQSISTEKIIKRQKTEPF